MKILNNLVKIIFLCCLSTVCAFSNSNPPTLAEQYVLRYQALEKRNDENERAGRKDLNQYIISLDTVNWIEEHPSINLIQNNYQTLSQILAQFNNGRKDKLRFYVIIAGTFQAQLKAGVKIEQLPNGPFTNFDVAFKGLLVEDDLNQVHHNAYGRAANAMRQEIMTALKARGYEERALYFYAAMRFYTSDGKEQYYTHDNLTLNGKLLTVSKQIRAKCRQGWAVPDIFGGSETAASRIEKAISNIISAIEIEYDGGGSITDGVVDCGKDITTLQSTTWPGKGEVYNNAAKRIAALLDAPTSLQRFKTPYLIVDQPANFTDPFVRDEVLPDIVFNTEILPDKLMLLSQGRSQYKMYVVFGSLEFVLPDSERAGFASLVKEFSAVAKQSNTIIIVVPYFSCVDAEIQKGDEHGNVHNLYPMLPMPCAYSPDDAMTSMMNSALVREKSFQGGFNQAFKYVPKDFKVYDWKVLWNGDAIYDGVEEYKNVTGYEDLVSIRILQDIRLDKINKVTRDRNCGAEGIIYDKSESMRVVDEALARMAKCENLLKGDVDRILNEPAQFQALTGTSSLIQSLLTEEVSKKFVETFASRKSAKNWTNIDDNLFYGKRNPFKSADIIMTLIDIGSIVTSVVGLDFIFDGIGMVYAFSIGENEAGLLYAAALSVPLVSGGELRTALIEGKNILVKGSKGAYRVVSREVYGLFYAVEHVDDFSHLAKSALQPKSFSVLSKYKSEATFVNAVEEGMLADGKSVQLLNDNPGWVEEFNAFYKEGKGELNTFLAAKTNGTLIDGERIIAFSDMPNLHVASLGSDADILKSVELIKPDPEWFDVIVHGSPDRFWVLHNGEWTGITHRDLYNYLKRNPAFQNAKGIRLVSCEAGTKELAQNFANKAGKKVRAVSGANIGVTKDGQIVATSGTGHWAEFDKGDWTISFDNAADVPQSNELRAAKASDEATTLVFFGNSTLTSVTKADGTVVVFTPGVSKSVGSGVLKSDGYLELSINVKIGDGGAKVASGGEVFEEIFTKIDAENPNSIQGVRGLWSDEVGISDNIDKFNELLLTEVKNNKMTEKEAALKTFTGKMATRKGFTNVSQIVGLKKPDGSYRLISYILFSKP